MQVFKIVYLLFLHWIADFVLQSDKDAKQKSKNFGALLHHTAIYSLFMLLGVMLIYPFDTILLIIFYLIMLISHTCIDYVTSRINSKLWNNNKNHLFFVSIGFDQILHYIVLFLSINYLYK